ILGMCLLAVNLFQVLLASEQEPHVTVIAILSTLVVALLFSPVKDRIQEGIDRLFFRERYNSRRALLRLSQDLNADLDLGRMGERLLEGVHAALGVSSVALFLPEEDGSFAVFKDLGCTPAAGQGHLPPAAGRWCAPWPPASPSWPRPTPSCIRRRGRSTCRTTSPAA